MSPKRQKRGASGPVDLGPGKEVGGALYLHCDALPETDPEIQEAVALASKIAGVKVGSDFNVVKADVHGGSVSLLSYPTFFSKLFPALHRSWTVDLETARATGRDFSASENPPILHRKELLLPRAHPARLRYQNITTMLERAGLLKDAHKIGHRAQWAERLKCSGLEVHGDALACPLSLVDESERAFVLRHRTAIRRFTLSAPFQLLNRAGYLDGSKSILDYGCGYGDDVRALEKQGVAVAGWDPHFAPDTDLRPADIVNLGFVLNVIETPRERAKVLKHAHDLANELLVVSVLRNGGYQSTARLYGDGVVTRRQTFQKTYAQQELLDFVDRVLGCESLPGVPGIVLVSKNPALRSELELTRAEWVRVAASSEWNERRVAASENRAERERVSSLLWEIMLELGRVPYDDEIESELLLQTRELFGSVKRAAALALRLQDGESYEQVRADRRASVLGELALQFVRRVRKFSALPEELQRDTRELFGSFKQGIEEAHEALRFSANPEKLSKAFDDAHERGVAVKTSKGELQFHSGNSHRLPALIQVVLSCTKVLLLQQVRSDIVSIKTSGPRVTHYAVDDLEGKPLPLGRQKVRVNLARQDVNATRLPLDNKTPVLVKRSRFLPPDSCQNKDQVELELMLERRLGLDPHRLWYPRGILKRGLDKERMALPI